MVWQSATQITRSSKELYDSWIEGKYQSKSKSTVILFQWLKIFFLQKDLDVKLSSTEWESLEFLFVYGKLALYFGGRHIKLDEKQS